jgi:hypothetical protein
MQIEHCLTPISLHMNMSWAVIIGVDGHAQTKKCEYSRHCINNPMSLGYCMSNWTAAA